MGRHRKMRVEPGAEATHYFYRLNLNSAITRTEQCRWIFSNCCLDPITRNSVLSSLIFCLSRNIHLRQSLMHRSVERCLNLNILFLKRRYLKLMNYDSRTAEQCKCEVSIRHFKLILFSLLSLVFLLFSFLSVIFGLSEKRTFLA